MKPFREAALSCEISRIIIATVLAQMPKNPQIKLTLELLHILQSALK